MKPVRTWAISAAAVVGISLFALWKVKQRPDGQPPPSSPKAARDNAAAGRARPVAPLRVALPSAPIPSSPDPANASSTEGAPENLPDIAELARKLDGRLAAPATDTGWGRQVRARIQGHVLADNPSSVLQSFDCGDTVCRARFVHTNPDGPRELGGRFTGSAAFDSELLFHYQDRLTSVYFAHRGSSLMATRGALP